MSKVDRKYGDYKRKVYCEKCGKLEFKEKATYDNDGFLIRKAKMKERNYLTIHHIDHNPLNNEHGNLQTLCRYCHQEIHKGEK